MNNSKNTPDICIIESLEPLAEEALESHIANKDAKPWHPSEIVPFEVDESHIEIDSAAKSAIYINGLTEDNLAHYTSTLKRLFGRSGPWAEWNNRWTWEESLHGRAIERYIDHLGIFDNNWLESARKIQLTTGNVPEPDSITEISIYASIQEELTRLAHSRLSHRLQGVGKKLFALIAGDELRHHHFYNTVATAIRERFPDEFAQSLYKTIKRFDMPGMGIPGYNAHAEDIENAGIFTSKDVAKAIGDIATQNWGVEVLGDETKLDESKNIAEKINKRLEVYRRLANSAIINSQNIKASIKWVNGRPIYGVQ